jgi:hypothetical protein
LKLQIGHWQTQLMKLWCAHNKHWCWQEVCSLLRVQMDTGTLLIDSGSACKSITVFHYKEWIDKFPLYMFVILLNCIIIVPYMNVAVRGFVLFSELIYVKCDMLYIRWLY